MVENDNTEDYTTSATGESDKEEFTSIIYPFDRFEIKVKLTKSGKFVEITSVKINKDFLSHAQRLNNSDVHDVEDYYKEEE